MMSSASEDLVDLTLDDEKGRETAPVSDVSEVVGGNTRPRPPTGTTGTARHWSFTAYGSEPKYDVNWMRYLVVGRETCPTTGRKHFQCHVYCEKPSRWSTVVNRLSGAHVEKSVDPQASIRYCMKDGDYTEYGVKPSQGSRTDITQLKDEIKAGRTVDSIVMENPQAYHQYGRTLTKIEDIVNANKRRNFQPEVTWIWGPTGTGKSHSVYSKETDLYVKCFNDDKWWDGYNFQEAVLLDDYRGEMKYNDMLQFLDKYHYTVPRRGRAPIAMMAKRIYITSSKKPEDVYLDQSDDIGQLLRRITKIENLTVRYVHPTV